MQTRQRHLTIIGANYPAMRRHTISGLGAQFRKSYASQSLLNPFEDTPKKLTLRQSEELIKNNFQKISCIIEDVDKLIVARLQNHENQVLAVMKGQIQGLRQLTADLVQQLNKRISQLSADEQIYNLQNELQYFKHEAYKLFQQNNKYRKDILRLKHAIKDFQAQIQNGSSLMQKLKKRLMKHKISKETIIDQIVANLSPQQTQQKCQHLDRQRMHDHVANRTHTQTSQQRQSFNIIINQQKAQQSQNINSFYQNFKKQISAKPSISDTSQKQQQFLYVYDASIDQMDSINLDSQKPSIQYVEAAFNTQLEPRMKMQSIQIGVQTDLFCCTQTICKANKQSFDTQQSIERYKQLRKPKNINFIKSGFIVNSPNHSLPKSTTVLQSKNNKTRRQRFKSNAFTKNKLPSIQDTLAIRHQSQKYPFNH